ncbi:GntR family transcriptional regulator [Bordetella genomosp. 1]|uniref:GntR family transcriptional regulator n=1 Tax=Bordetella genomosp. 1 TaxID=1395607 RepID=A0A261SQQ0_9BORD|nr:FadR/GntR family transcriptional regulator [Bordetella genomosp. 1]OZI39475.1 GntR family transcriptional regulator [Bordetella genomosp. 1]OZI65702.1 GntR family transcriptional regulator [Bordetella genomosp. 1]
MARPETVSDALFGSLARPDNLPDEIAQQIREKIVSQAFEPGQRLPTEQELAQRFGVSRNVVREAIARLKLSGYIETRRGVGSFVAADPGLHAFELLPADLLRADALEHVYQLRVEIEAGAAALAAQHRTEAQIDQLRDALRQVDEASGDWRQGAARALDFHMAVCQASNNPYFVRLLSLFGRAIGDAVRTLRYCSTGTDRVTQIEQEHHRIFDAIVARDSEAARAAMREHLSNGMQRRQALLKDQPPAAS